MARPLPLVRIAQQDDEDDLIVMCRRLHEENGLFSFNEDKVRETIHRCFRREGVILGVIGSPGELKASTCMVFSDFYYTSDWHLAEMWNFVEKEYRSAGLRYAEALIEYGKKCARDVRLPFITGIITNKHMAGKVRLYRRLLGYPAGALFLYNGNWKSEPMADHRDLLQSLRAAAKRCSTNKVRTKSDLEQVASLLSHAADAIGSDDNIWGSARAAVPNNDATVSMNRNNLI